MILLVLFLTVLNIFNDESVNKTFRNKKWPDQNGWPKIKFEYKLGWNSVHGTPVPDITDYKLKFITQKFQTTDPIWQTKTIKKKNI